MSWADEPTWYQGRDFDPTAADADRKVARFVLQRWDADGRPGSDEHLKQCSGPLAVEHLHGEDGEYGCDTGCEYWRLEARVLCPHGHRSTTYTYGDFGMLNDLLVDLDRGA